MDISKRKHNSYLLLASYKVDNLNAANVLVYCFKNMNVKRRAKNALKYECFLKVDVFMKFATYCNHIFGYTILTQFFLKTGAYNKPEECFSEFIEIYITMANFSSV